LVLMPPGKSSETPSVQAASPLVASFPFFDEPQFTVAGVKDNTYRGGHGSDAALQSAESLAKETAALADPAPTANALETVQHLQRAAEANPTEPNLFDWGAELLSHRAPEPAAQVFAKGVRLFPQSVRMNLGLATALYNAGSYKQAAHWFFQATDVNPSDPGPYRFLGNVQSSEITQLAGYQERLARFVLLQPDNPLANYYDAVSIWSRATGPDDLGAYRNARALLEKAIVLDPNLGPAYLQVGILDASQRKYADAIRSYRKAIEVSPELEEAHYRLSLAYRLNGDREKANEELTLYNKLSQQSAARLERERSEIQQFVIDLRTPNPVR